MISFCDPRTRGRVPKVGVVRQLGGVLRLLVALLGCMLCLATVSSQASAAGFSGAPSAPYGESIRLGVSYSDEFGFACGAGLGFCSATVYSYDLAGNKRLASYCGHPTTDEVEPCSVEVRPNRIDGNILTHSMTGRFEVCEGVDTACSGITVSWPPFPVNLSLTGVSDGSGSVVAKLSNGSYGVPGSVVLFDENHKRVMPLSYSTEDDRFWRLDGCAGPYFRATITVGNPTGPGEETRTTGIVRIDGISSGGEPCHGASPGGGGDGGTGGGGGGGVPAPPKAMLSGPGTYTIPDEPQVVVSPSETTDYPYEMVVLDTTDGNRVVGACMASTTCGVRLNADVAARGPVVHRLVSETRLSGERVAAGETMDLTVNPFPVKAKIKSLGLRADGGGGSVTVRIWNVGGRAPMSGYRIQLEQRDPEAERPRWRPTTDCGIDLDCATGVAFAERTDGKPTVTELRSAIFYGTTRLDTSPILRLKTIAGLDYDAVLAAMPGWCAAFIEHNQGAPTGTSLNSMALKCAAFMAGTLGAIQTLQLIFAEAIADGTLPETISVVADELRGAATGVFGGGSSGTAAAQAAIDQIDAELLEALKQSNNSTPETKADPTLLAKVVTACTTFAAVNARAKLSGILPGGFIREAAERGLDFCRVPDKPFFIMGTDVDQVSGHAYQGIFGGAQRAPQLTWGLQHYEYAGERGGTGKTQIQGPANRRWYTKIPEYPSLCGSKIAENSALQCDEFPAFATQEGGRYATLTPSIKAVDGTQNRVAGSLYNGRLIQRCGLETGQFPPTLPTSNAGGGSGFYVLPMPSLERRDPLLNLPFNVVPVSPSTFGLCNQGRTSGGGGGVS